MCAFVAITTRCCSSLQRSRTPSSLTSSKCGVDETSQRKYLSTVRVGKAPHPRAPPQHKRPPPPPTGPPAYPRKRKKKNQEQQNDRKPPPPPFPPPQREPRRQRTPEEIWRAFREEEERLAREEFHAKGFERTCAASSSDQRMGDTEAGNENSSSMDAEMQETILNSGLDEKARRWATWRQSPKTPAKGTTENAEVSSSASGAKSCVNHKIDPVGSTTPAAAELICCLLCQRKFPTHDALGNVPDLYRIVLSAADECVRVQPADAVDEVMHRVDDGVDAELFDVHDVQQTLRAAHEHLAAKLQRRDPCWRKLEFGFLERVAAEIAVLKQPPVTSRAHESPMREQTHAVNRRADVVQLSNVTHRVEIEEMNRAVARAA
ncbi:hypothetical protein FI667_g6354, partial [Globisporangium splendens]